MFLLIQNEGEAPIEAFTVLGDSGSRHRDGLIGQFGSGNKHGINLLLRLGVEFYIYSGPNKLEFFPERVIVTEADGRQRDSLRVKCRVSGKINRTIDCGWTLDFGALDWREVRMALREFVSNAIDCSKLMGSKPEVKPEATPRAKSGQTRVFVSMNNADVVDFYRNLGVHFLHFSPDAGQVDKTFLRKNPETLGPRVYLNGVLVNELRSTVKSAFDYNFTKNEVRIDECRNSDEYALRARIAQRINKADKETLATLFEAMSKGDVFESTLDDFYLSYSTDENVKENWNAAWQTFAGEAVIASESLADSKIGEHVAAKGHKVVPIKSKAFVQTAEKMGVRNVATVLGSQGASGKIECDTTEAAVRAVDTVWSWCETTRMTGGKAKPEVRCFRQLMDGEGETLGFYTPGSNAVNIREDLDGKIALKTAIEEVAHYITGSTDCSRDFQNFAFDMIVELCV